MPQTTNILHMSNTTYDRLRFLTLVLLPALGTLYFALGQIWDFPSIEQVLGTVVAIEIFLGAILGISNSQHKSEIANRPESKLFVSEDGTAYADFAVGLEEFNDREEVHLRVIKT